MSDSKDAAVEELAEQLRALKERSGRSYGALARRLNVSASTLYRYCSGATVPARFTPIEQLARLCQATAEERLRLQRLWILADEARRPTLPSAVTPSTAPTGPEDAGATPPEWKEPTRHTTAPPVPPVTDTQSRTDAQPAPARRTRRFGRASRVKVMLAVATFAVGAAVVALAGMGPLFTSPPGESSPGPTPGADARAAPSSTAGDGPGATPEDDSRSVPKSTPDDDRSPSSSAGPDQNANPPFAWTVDSHVWQQGCAHTYLVDRAPDQVPAPPIQQDARSWANGLGAVHGGDTIVRLTLQGTSSQAVVLEALRVRVAERTKPLAWNAYRIARPCGGGLSPRHFDVDLDQPHPTARSVAGFDDSGDEMGKEIPAVSFPLTVSPADPEVLRVNARTANCDCRWYLEVEWSSQGRSGTVRVTDNGRPFRTSGVRDSAGFVNDHSSARDWKPDRS